MSGAPGRDLAGRRALEAEAIRLLQGRIAELARGVVEAPRLALSRRLTRGIDECAVSTRTREATAQIRAAGVEIYPGERLRYVVVDTQAKEAPRRVREAEINPGSGYDAEEYIRLLRLAAAEVLNTYDARRPGVPAAEQLPLPF